MELVRVLPSAEDEVNVACFHPLAGGGLVYGTKEGKLRILQYNRQHDTNCTGPNFFFEENLLEARNLAIASAFLSRSMPWNAENWHPLSFYQSIYSFILADN
uniref:Uncharacterized protein n=1 Tax=Ananas comosus var. bracteatus TaxID=296719 RepID=A0A6V7PJ59_ANACO|nr:unnamed protein product [Ananas comosus var. bracteatus]